MEGGESVFNNLIGKKVWKVDEGKPEFSAEELRRDRLPAPEPHELVAAAKSFPQRTGLGADLVHPRWAMWLSEGALRVWCTLIVLMEMLGRPPSALLSIIFFIAKREGGVRPIGLLSGFLRLWERVRRPVMKAWEAAHAEEFFAAAAGRSAEHTVWTQSVWQEFGYQHGMVSVSSCLD